MNSLIAGLVAVIGALGGFYFGAKYGQGHPPPSSTTTTVASTTTGPSPGTSRTVVGGGAGGGAAVLGSAAAGQITAVSGDVITVHDRQTNKDVKVNVATARIAKTDQGTVTDLTQNAIVTVIGQTGADGTVTAQLITIGGGQGAFGGGGQGGVGGGRRGGSSPSPSG
ncbi:MAG TPA: hypothetical protein VKI99_00160 [Candidatus Dormibacteraeota bacterium]|nr:hypothetical protein [Candidatus Dormibacteraeota bacterium]